MNIEIGALVVRADGEVIDVIPIEDMYSDVFITVLMKYIEPREIYEFYSNLPGSYAMKKVDDCVKSGVFREQGEAKDLVYNFDRVKIAIETKTINWS